MLSVGFQREDEATGLPLAGPCQSPVETAPVIRAGLALRVRLWPPASASGRRWLTPIPHSVPAGATWLAPTSCGPRPHGGPAGGQAHRKAALGSLGSAESSGRGPYKHSLGTLGKGRAGGPLPLLPPRPLARSCHEMPAGEGWAQGGRKLRHASACTGPGHGPRGLGEPGPQTLPGVPPAWGHEPRGLARPNPPLFLGQSLALAPCVILGVSSSWAGEDRDPGRAARRHPLSPAAGPHPLRAEK